MGEKTSFLELGTTQVTPEQVRELEVKVNEQIRQGARMYPTLYDSKDDPRFPADVSTYEYTTPYLNKSIVEWD